MNMAHILQCARHERVMDSSFFRSVRHPRLTSTEWPCAARIRVPSGESVKLRSTSATRGAFDGAYEFVDGHPTLTVERDANHLGFMSQHLREQSANRDVVSRNFHIRTGHRYHEEVSISISLALLRAALLQLFAELIYLHLHAGCSLEELPDFVPICVSQISVL
jgi:hypothetical protein